jgi:predicted nucleic acid-binding protein
VNPVLLDTGCIVALLDRSENHHEACVETVSTVEDPLITCEAVIAESCYLLRDLGGAPEAVLANVESDTFIIPFRLKDSASTVTRLMKKYRDVPMDFADACLVSLAEAFQTGRILTLDRDFHVYRWGRNRPFDLLLEI